MSAIVEIDTGKRPSIVQPAAASKQAADQK